MSKVRWGVLGTANIAVGKVIPALQKSGLAEVSAIASRDLGKARAAADRLRIPNAYGSYEELLASPEVDVVYNPLPWRRDGEPHVGHNRSPDGAARNPGSWCAQ